MTPRKALYPELLRPRAAVDPASLAAFFSKRSPLLRGLDETLRLALARAAVVRTINRGQFVCRAGDAAREIWVLLEGRVSVNRSGMVGNRLCIEIMVPGDVFGLPALACRFCPSEIQAMRDSRLAAVPKETVGRLIDGSPRLAQVVLQAISQRLNYVETALLLSRDPLPRRAAAALVYLFHKFGSVVPMTRTEIGEMVGAAPETTMRLLKDFERNGWIRRRPGDVVIADIVALREQVGAAA